MRHFLATNFGAIATITVGFAAAFVSILQWRLAKRKLRLDLFDRRYKVYEGTRKFLSVILRDATFKDADLFEFYAATSDAEFLFGDDITRYLKEIRVRAVDMRTHEHIFRPLPVGEERSKHVEANADQLMWLGNQLAELKRPFLPYMSFAEIDDRFDALFSVSPTPPREGIDRQI